MVLGVLREVRMDCSSRCDEKIGTCQVLDLSSTEN